MEKFNEISNEEKLSFEIYDAILHIDSASVDSYVEKLKPSFLNSPNEATRFLSTHLLTIPFTWSKNVFSMAQFIQKIYGEHSNSSIDPNYRNLLAQDIVGQCCFFRETNVLLGNLISLNMFTPDEVQELIRKVTVFVFIEQQPVLFSFVFISSLFVSCKDYIKSNFPDLAIFLSSNINFHRFPSPQSRSLLQEFELFINKNEIKPQKYLDILREDKPDLIPTDIDKEQEFYPSIFDSSPLVFCPSLISAAAYFKANKCVKKLLELGFSPDVTDQMGKSLPYFAGIAGNFEALEIVGLTQERLTVFIKAAIKTKQNVAFHLAYEKVEDKDHIFDNGATILHKACAANNIELVKEFAEKIDINTKDECDDLPQHIAARHNALESIILLSKLPTFDLEAKNYSGLTILDLAVNYGCVSTVASLVKNLHPVIDCSRYSFPDNENLSGCIAEIKKILNSDN